MATSVPYIWQVSPASGSKVVLDALDWDNPPGMPQGGVGGWTNVQRPRMVDGQEWVSTPLSTWPVSFYLHSAIDAQMRRMNGWGSPLNDGSPPPVLGVAGFGFDRMRWVIAGEGDLVFKVLDRSSWDTPTLVGVTLTLTEYRGLTAKPTTADSVRADLVSVAAAAGKVVSVKTVIAKSGDTYASIALRLLHNRNRWTDIAKLNGSRSDMKLKAGTKVKVPAT